MGIIGLVLSVLATVSSATPPEFFSSHTTVERSSTRVVAFGVQPAGDDRVFPTSVSDRAILEVLRAGEALAERGIGYVRIRALQPGEAVLTVGESQIRVLVVDGDVLAQAPRMVTPAGAAAVWGTVGVCVEIFDTPGVFPAKVVLETSAGQTLSPTSESPPSMGPHRRVVFELDAASFLPGELVLTPVSIGADGSRVEGEAVALRVVRPADVVEGEAEENYEVERPARFAKGNAKPPVGRDAEASGGAYRNNAGAYPPLCFPVTVERAGEYQVVVRVAGDLGGGALPTVALYIDEEEYPRMSGRLASERWHRLPLGGPIRLEAGKHVLTVLFANDFHVAGLADRNLRLDTIEVARLEDGPLDLPALGVAKSGNALMDAQRSAMAMSMMARAMSGGEGEADHMGLEDAALRIAFDHVLEGLPIAGELEVRGLVHAVGALEDPDPMRAPVVSLLVNGEVLDRQRTLAPRFWIDAPVFQSGTNTLQFVAELAGGARAETPVQTLHYGIEPGAIDRPARRMHRFGVRDERWGEDARRRLTKRGWGTEQLAFAFMSAGTGTLMLPAELRGRYELYLTARGEDFEGPAVARLELEREGQVEPLGEHPIPGGWRTERLGEIELAGGDQRLRISFINDRYEKDVGDRNLLVQSVILREIVEHRDVIAPVAEVVHPRNGETVHLADALVARVHDDAGVRQAELLVNGEPTGCRSVRTGRDGLVVLPIAARSWAAGEHTLTLRTTDLSGNTADSAPVVVVVAGSEPPSPTRYARAVHVLNRFGFGPAPHDLARILAIGERAWLAEQLDAPGDHPAEAAALGPALVRFPMARNAQEPPRRAVQHAMLTRSPARVRLVHWLDNHFSTWVRKVEGDREWTEFASLHRLGASRFVDVLLASAQSPAMLAYLDQEQSFAGRINENYARELMELHTLGVDGGYTQEDVTSLARLLTGWTSSMEGDPGAGGIAREYNFRFDPALNDGGAFEVVGARFEAAPRPERFERALRALETLAAHPSTAEFIATKLAEHYAGLPADEGLARELTRVFHESGGDLRAMLMAILDHEAFWASGPRVRRPLDYALNLSRLAEQHDNPWRVGDFLQRCGTQVFDRPTPDGYPEEDEAQADSNSMLQRWALANDLRWILASRVPDPLRWNNADSAEGWEQLVVDYLAIGITGGVLGERSNEAAVEYLGQLGGNCGERVLALAPFVAQLPEANLK